MELTALAINLLRGLPLIGRIVNWVFEDEDLRVTGIKMLGRNQDKMIDIMAEKADDTEEMLKALSDAEHRYKVGDTTISKDIHLKSPFEK